jgi:hypothetical protein
MPNCCSPLNEMPTFPVYGIAGTGERWLGSWASSTLLWQVTLCFRNVDNSSFISVGTYRKLPKQRITRSAAIGPTGRADAFLAARLQLQASEELIDPSRGADLCNVNPQWESVQVTVDLEKTSAVLGQTESKWAMVVDLPTVAIAISGPLPRDADIQLETVNNELADYLK